MSMAASQVNLPGRPSRWKAIDSATTKAVSVLGGKEEESPQQLLDRAGAAEKRGPALTAGAAAEQRHGRRSAAQPALPRTALRCPRTGEVGEVGDALPAREAWTGWSEGAHACRRAMRWSGEHGEGCVHARKVHWSGSQAAICSKRTRCCRSSPWGPARAGRRWRCCGRSAPGSGSTCPTVGDRERGREGGIRKHCSQQGCQQLRCRIAARAGTQPSLRPANRPASQPATEAERPHYRPHRNSLPLHRCVRGGTVGNTSQGTSRPRRATSCACRSFASSSSSPSLRRDHACIRRSASRI